jgi:hypothetical protein
MISAADRRNFRGLFGRRAKEQALAAVGVSE